MEELTSHNKTVRVGSLVRVNKAVWAVSKHMSFPYEGIVTKVEPYTDSSIEDDIITSDPYGGWWANACFFIGDVIFGFNSQEDVDAIEILKY